MNDLINNSERRFNELREKFTNWQDVVKPKNWKLEQLMPQKEQDEMYALKFFLKRHLFQRPIKDVRIEFPGITQEQYEQQRQKLVQRYIHLVL